MIEEDRDQVGQKTWNIAIIGSGNIAQIHAEAIGKLLNVKLFGIYGRTLRTAQVLAAKYQCRAYDSLDDLLAEKDLDIVTIATPSGTHLEYCVKVAAAKKHVICEKPVEISAERILRVMNACQQNEVRFSGIYNRRFNSAVTVLKRSVDEGRFGQLVLCSAYIRWHRTQAYYDSADWRGTIALDGGGAMMNQGIHTLDLLQYLAGPVKRLSATMACLTHENIEVEDTIVAILEYENGARGTVEASTSCWSTDGHAAEIHLYGSGGSAILADDHIKLWDFKQKQKIDKQMASIMLETRGGSGAKDPKAIDAEGHRANFQNVIDALEGRDDIEISGREAMKSVRLIEAMYHSAAHDGQWMNIK